MNIDKGSMHYRLFSVYGDGDYYGANLCHYVSRCFVGSLVVSLIIAIGVLMSAAVLEPFAVLIMYLHTGLFNPGFFLLQGGLFPSALLYFIAFVVLVYHGIRHVFISYRNKRAERLAKAASVPVEEVPADSFDILIAWIKAKHDKVCFKINFIDRE